MRVALYGSTTMMKGGGVGGEHLLCPSSLFRLMFDGLWCCLRRYGICGALVVQITSQTGVWTPSASRKVVFFVIWLYFWAKKSTLCTTSGCIFKHHTMDFAGRFLLGYTNLHSILCSQGTVWLVLKTKSYVVVLREYTTLVVFRR